MNYYLKGVCISREGEDIAFHCTPLLEIHDFEKLVNESGKKNINMGFA